MNPNLPGPFHSRIQREETINWSLHQPPRTSFIVGDKIWEFQMHFLKNGNKYRDMNKLNGRIFKN